MISTSCTGQPIRAHASVTEDMWQHPHPISAVQSDQCSADPVQQWIATGHDVNLLIDR